VNFADEDMVAAYSLHLNAKLPVFDDFPTGIPATSSNTLATR
jgi:hypothetical protein